MLLVFLNGLFLSKKEYLWKSSEVPGENPYLGFRRQLTAGDVVIVVDTVRRVRFEIEVTQSQAAEYKIDDVFKKPIFD